jgi:hypothetical protein
LVADLPLWKRVGYFSAEVMMNMEMTLRRGSFWLSSGEHFQSKISFLVFPGFGFEAEQLALRTDRRTTATGAGTSATRAGAAAARTGTAARGTAVVAIVTFIAVMVAIFVFIVIAVIAEAKPGPREMAVVIAGKGRG